MRLQDITKKQIRAAFKKFGPKGCRGDTGTGWDNPPEEACIIGALAIASFKTGKARRRFTEDWDTDTDVCIGKVKLSKEEGWLAVKAWDNPADYTKSNSTPGQRAALKKIAEVSIEMCGEPTK